MENELLQVQFGKQSVFATAVAGTVKLMGASKCSLKPTSKTDFRKHVRGSLAPSYLPLITEIGGGGSIEEDVSYEDAAYALDELFGEATPSGGGPYVRAYNGPLATKPTPRLNTIIYGNSVDGVYKLAGGLTTKVVVKSNKQGVWTISREIVGYDVTTGTLASLSDRTINALLGQDTTIYLDAKAGTIGTTALAATMYDFELTIDTKRAVKRHMTVRADSYKQPAWDVSLKLNLEFNATSKTELDAILSATPAAPWEKQIRIKGTSGTNILQFDLGVAQEDAPEIFTDEDGVSTVEINAKAVYNSTLANYLKASSTNGVSVLA